MRKAERLFQILTLLRGRRTVITAQQLAELLEVSERTIYRDLQALILSGMPIDSEVGVGYRLNPGFTIPPLMFNEQELEAMLLGARMVQGWGGERMASAAASALTKIHAVLPDQLHRQTVQQPEWLLVPDYNAKQYAQYSDQLGEAIKHKSKIIIRYQREDGETSQRIIWPLGLVFWGNRWTLVAWCELRDEYRMFRLDRIQVFEFHTDKFETHELCSLQHYLKHWCG